MSESASATFLKQFKTIGEPEYFDTSQTHLAPGAALHILLCGGRKRHNLSWAGEKGG